VQAVNSEAWTAPCDLGANRDGNGSKVRDIVERTFPEGDFFWESVELIQLLKPFSDAIHSLEAERPMLSQCHEVVMALRQHVSAFVHKHRGTHDLAVAFRLQETFDRRYEAVAGGVRAPINNAAYAAAYLLDPCYVVKDIQDGQEVWNPPELSSVR
jgi:hypothetical protein